MSNSKNKDAKRRELLMPSSFQKPASLPQKSSPIITSLLDVMADGREYGSILDANVCTGFDVLDDLVKCIQEIELARQRRCIAYIGNVVSPTGPDAGITQADDTPFYEMIAQIPANETRLDVLLATPGGSADQVGRFVNALRPRFAEVDFLIPSFCMSAGTLFALSGDNIWMSERGCLGPIDPQVQNKDRRFVPAQTILLLVEEIHKQGQAAIDANKPVPWSVIQLINSLDKKELGHAMTATKYATQMAMEFIKTYKFKTWTVKETSKVAVTDEDRAARAQAIADALASHDRWKNHGHGITRNVLQSEIQLRASNKMI
jgi:hypothetical protein